MDLEHHLNNPLPSDGESMTHLTMMTHHNSLDDMPGLTNIPQLLLKACPILTQFLDGVEAT